jgi:hypothetical protein
VYIVFLDFFTLVFGIRYSVFDIQNFTLSNYTTHLAEVFYLQESSLLKRRCAELAEVRAREVWKTFSLKATVIEGVVFLFRHFR